MASDCEPQLDISLLESLAASAQMNELATALLGGEPGASIQAPDMGELMRLAVGQVPAVRRRLLAAALVAFGAGVAMGLGLGVAVALFLL